MHTKLHQSEHHEDGIDEIGEGALLPQDPTEHASTHESGGSDELSLDATQIADGSVSNTEFQYLDGVETYVADKDYVDSKVQGIDWQDSVLDKDVSDPSTLTPSDGDRYIVASDGTGDWSGQDEEIAEYDGDSSSWEFITPDEGTATWVEDENTQYVYNDEYDTGEWVKLGGTEDHGNLTGLSDDDHTQYLLVDGTRSMDGSLDMGTNNITNVGDVDGIDVSEHDHDGDAPSIPNAGLDNSSVTVAGNEVSLGSSTDISHSDLSGVSYDDHHGVGNAIEWDGSNNIAVASDGISTDELDLSMSPSWTGTHDFTGGSVLLDHHSQSGEPTVDENEIVIWTDTDNDQSYIGYNDGDDTKWVELTVA